MTGVSEEFTLSFQNAVHEESGVTVAIIGFCLMPITSPGSGTGRGEYVFRLAVWFTQKYVPTISSPVSIAFERNITGFKSRQISARSWPVSRPVTCK